MHSPEDSRGSRKQEAARVPSRPRAALPSWSGRRALPPSLRHSSDRYRSSTMRFVQVRSAASVLQVARTRGQIRRGLGRVGCAQTADLSITHRTGWSNSRSLSRPDKYLTSHGERHRRERDAGEGLRLQRVRDKRGRGAVELITAGTCATLNEHAIYSGCYPITRISRRSRVDFVELFHPTPLHASFITKFTCSLPFLVVSPLVLFLSSNGAFVCWREHSVIYNSSRKRQRLLF